MDSKIRQIHMVGIGGAGMSGIAEVLLNLGYDISGSDMSDSAVVKHLRSLGARIAVGHAAENVGNVQVLVKSTAIAEDNPEVVEARRRNIAIIPRAEMLAELMRLRQGVAIAGTHGKTTTTSLTASIFDTAGLDPTVIIGGRLNVYGTNAHLGSGHYLIAEADESDGSFLCLFPIINVVTNVDEDHLDHYGTRQAIDDAFVQFMNKVPFYGLNVVCGDDPGVRALLPRVKRPVLTYGFAADNQLRAVLLESGMTSRFEVWRDDQKLGEVTLPHPGRHNILTALAAIGAATAAEDEKDLSKREMSLDMFRIFTKGFLTACTTLTDKELEMLPMGAKTMTMECGVRFLTDYLDGDHYFAVHREGHNLVRARTQFKLVQDMDRKMEAMKAIVKEESGR